MSEYIVRKFNVQDIENVISFNKRLRLKGSNIFFLEEPFSFLLPNVKGRDLYREHYICIDNSNEVRGGYVLHSQLYYINGEYHRLVDFILPISEGLIDKKYNLVIFSLIQHAQKKCSNLFALGMGGRNSKIAKFHKANRWIFNTIPFFFKIYNVSSFLKNLNIFKSTNSLRLIAKILDKLLFVHFLIHVFNFFYSFKYKNKLCEYEQIKKFDNWADLIWNEAKDSYYFIAKKDYNTLNILYSSNKNLILLRIYERESTVGWCVLKKSNLSGHNHFGDMILGSIIDVLSIPGKEELIIAVIMKYFDQNSVDLLVTNQSHIKYISSLRKFGFFKGPSNFEFATSRKLSKLLNNENINNFHINRGDGDGPNNL